MATKHAGTVRVLLGLALALLIARPAHADSATFRFEGVCDGTDMWQHWQISGHRSSPDTFLRPWDDRRLRIDGYELIKLQEPSFWPRQFLLNRSETWFMLGTTIGTTDALVALGPGESHIEVPSRGQIVPAQRDARPVKTFTAENGTGAASGDLFDLHGQCYGGVRVMVLVTLRYTPLP